MTDKNSTMADMIEEVKQQKLENFIFFLNRGWKFESVADYVFSNSTVGNKLKAEIIEMAKDLVIRLDLAK